MAPAPKAYKITVFKLGTVTLQEEKAEGVIKDVRELRYPSKFEPSQAASDTKAVTPLSPTEFHIAEIGWTVRPNAKAHGQLIAVSGAAEFVEEEMFAGRLRGGRRADLFERG
jgi:hypothetical protein